MTKVYDGTAQFTANEWTEIVFDTPFEYDATENLLVMVYRPVPASPESPNFEYTTFDEDNYKAIYRHGTVELTSGYRLNERSNTSFTMCVDAEGCLPVQNLRV